MCSLTPFSFSWFSWLIKMTVVAVVLCLGAVAYAVPVQIDFFYEPGCLQCEQIEAEILPEIGKRFGDSCVIQPHDIGIETNFLTLLQLEDAIGHEGPDRAYLIVEKQVAFGPRPDLQELCSVISNFVGREPRPRNDSAITDRGYKGAAVEGRYSDFTLPAVLIAGLLDGMNPCAISTLVFFMSLLAVSRVRNRQLLAVGISFCLASFVTYLAIGFGLLRFLHLFSGFTVLRSAVERGMVALLVLLAWLSFRDAARFRKSRDGHDVTLQLSTGMKKRIHNVMRRGLKTGHLIFGGLMIGVLVTALESVCTGQVYVPTLVLILRNSALAESRAWMYLITYNLLFVLPLILTFIAVYFGLRTETLQAWSRRNVAVSKTLLGLFFLLMAALLFLF
jgi:cytochrome c biogenesis protein CcdA